MANYYWKDATLASAKELTAMIDRNINAIQRNMKRSMEAGFFERLLVANKISDVVPRIVWGIETTGVEDLQMESIIAEALKIGMIGPKQLTTLLKLMGLNIGELGWDLEEPEPEEEEPTLDDDVPPEDDEEEDGEITD